MAKVYPDIKKARVVFASGSEQVFYQKCIEQLNNDWHVFHSCNLSTLEKGKGQRDNEIDFVIYHPKYGVIIVEVKGGRIKFDQDKGAFYSINRHNESFEIKDPFQQALVWKSRFIKFLKPLGVRVPICHCVCFPSANESEFPRTTNIEPTLIIGRNKLDHLTTHLEKIATLSHPEKYLNFKDVGNKLVDLLVGSTFTTKLHLRDYIDGHESRVKDIESINETLLTPIANSPKLGIEGEAGTGKTIIAIMLARKFRDAGKRVLVLSSNSLLNLYLRKIAGPGIKMQTYTEVASGHGIHLLIPDKNYQGTKEEWIQLDGPARLLDAIKKNKERYDVIICDEAQDVQPFWWDAFKEFQSSENSNFYVFFDRSQGIFGSGAKNSKFEPETALPIKGPYFPLVHNYRNTREIAGFARHFRTGKTILQSHCGRLGYIPEILTYETPEQCRDLVDQVMKKLVDNEGVGTNEITLLSARDPAAKDSTLYQTKKFGKIPIHRLTHNKKTNWKDAKAPEGAVGVSTIAGFKGLETSIGILLNISEYKLSIKNPIMSSLIYVACTRAKHMLYILVKKGDGKEAAFNEALAKLNQAGAMVLEGSDADFEFNGTVSHYNPERVGWLSIEDPAFQKSSIMFFPKDIQDAGIRTLKVGDQIKFRPRLEGQTTIATDLKLLKVATAPR